jgi:hypothetical protein
VKRNKYTNFDIVVKGYDEAITNETQCLGLLNTTHLSDCVQMRVSTYIVFYITDLYL